MRVSGANVEEFRRVLNRFAADTRAATAIEYAIIAAGVGAAIAATIWSLGSTIQTTLYNKIAEAMN